MNKNLWEAFDAFEHHPIIFEIPSMTNHCYSLGFQGDFQYPHCPKVSWLSLILLEDIEDDPSPLQLDTRFQIRMVYPVKIKLSEKLILPIPLLKTSELIDCLGDYLIFCK